jgi:hypothetical protein
MEKMTANELADKLDEIYTGIDYAEIKQAATMLRQQAKEIAILKQIIDANNLQSDIGQFFKKKYSDEWWKEVALLNKTFPFGGWK